MPYVYLGRSGLRVSKVGLGTWKIGYPETGDGSRVDEKSALKILDRAIELGVTFWDTANRYNSSSGNSERVIGTWLANNPDQRRNVVLATKLFGCMDGKTPNHCRLGRIAIIDAVEASLERLGVDRIDLLYFHHYDPFTPIEESLSAVSDLIAADQVGYFALSNYTRDQLRLYHSAAAEGYPRPLAVQNGFNVLEGAKPGGEGVLEYCAQHGISYIAWSPLGAGLLTNRYLDPSKVGKGDRLVDENALEAKLTAETRDTLNRLAQLANEWGLTVSRLALAYTLTLPGMGPVIPSASTVAQLEDNAEAGIVTLNDEQRGALRAVFAGNSDESGR